MLNACTLHNKKIGAREFIYGREFGSLYTCDRVYCRDDGAGYRSHPLQRDRPQCILRDQSHG